ncbi:MAG TPA: T9SS type A sorting domain-containing protein [Saprospiraceae bacterium]|nr:T9SS type A sorting domain-containing protein [Saprospiraceae bacterium]
MTLLTFIFLSLLSWFDLYDHSKLTTISNQPRTDVDHMITIDSMDRVIFSLDQIIIIGDVVEIPVFVATDDLINSLDFSMLVNVENLEYLSIIEHAEDLQYAAFLNPNDLKLRFTSNSFTPYPVAPFQAISVRFRVLSPTLKKEDFSDFACYLNGEKCTCDLLLKGEEIMVNNKHIATNDMFISPNPATDFLYIESDEEGTLDMFDTLGRPVIRGHKVSSYGPNNIDVQQFPRGSYTVRIITSNQMIKTQKILLQ